MNGDILMVVLKIALALVVFALFFSASVFFHELGHFLAARWRGLVVDKFAIGFPPIIWKKRVNGVDWCIGATPFGGFVALPQLAGVKAIEGEGEARKLPEISWLDKVIVALAGPVFSMIFAFLLGCLIWATGVPELKGPNLVGYVREKVSVSEGVEVESPAKLAGLRVGDRILSVDGSPTPTFDDLQHAILLGKKSTQEGKPMAVLEIEREGARQTLEIFPVLESYGRTQMRTIGVSYPSKIIVNKIYPNSPAASAGLRDNDIIESWNGIPLTSWKQWSDLNNDSKIKDGSASPVKLGVRRDSGMIDISVTPAMATVDTAGGKKLKMGFEFRTDMKPITLRRPPWERIGNGLQRTWQTLSALVSPSSSVGIEMMNGPVAMGHGVYYLLQRDLREVIALFLMINVSLAIFNMLPLPVLDGGHITVAVLSKIRGKPLPETFMGYLQSAFVVMFLGLMLFVVFNDSRNVVHDVKTNLNTPTPLAAPVFDPVPSAPTKPAGSR